MYELQSPNSQITVRPGNIVKLNRFDDECWVVNLGWFSYAGNRPMNGWYLVSTSHKDKVKPLNLSDLDDIYVVEIGEVKEDYKELDPKIKKLIHDLKVQVEDLQAQVAQLTVEVEAKDKVIEEKGQEILILQKQINDLAAEIDALESQHNLDVETIETLNSQVRAQAEIIAEKAAEIGRLTTRVEELAAENEVLSQQHQEDLATIAQQASTIQEQAQSIATLTAENEELTDENGRLTDENAELVTQHEADVETISEQATEIEAKDGQISELNDEITEKDGQITELNTENARLENLTDTQRETIQNMLDNPPQPKLYTPPVVTPSGSVQQINPPTGYDGLNNAVVDRVSAEGVGFNPDYYKEGKTCLGKVGTYNPFPERSYGGIYYTELGEGGYPKKILIKDMLRSASTIPQFFNASNDAKRELREVVFENCPEILTIPNNLFQGFNYLTKVILHDSLKNIGGGTFANCASLMELTLPNSLKTIGGGAFVYCTSLMELTLPNSLTSIGPQVFDGCSRLTNLTLAQGFNCNGLSVSSSTRFTAETIVSCLEALADRTGLTAYTITFGSTNLNKLTAEQKAIATNKNWNLA